MSFAMDEHWIDFCEWRQKSRIEHGQNLGKFPPEATIIINGRDVTFEQFDRLAKKIVALVKEENQVTGKETSP